jgi:hypothetical protein
MIFGSDSRQVVIGSLTVANAAVVESGVMSLFGY